MKTNALYPPYTPAPEVQKAKRKKLERNKGIKKEKRKQNKSSLVQQQTRIKLNLSMHDLT